MCPIVAILFESWAGFASIPVLWTRYLAYNSDLLVWICYMFERLGSATSHHLSVTNAS
jgi:hypothetical protein